MSLFDMLESWGPVVEALGLALLHFIWQGLLLGLLFWIALSILRHADSRYRYWSGVVTLVLLASAVPLTTAYLLASAVPSAGNVASSGGMLISTGTTTAGALQSAGSAGSLVYWTVAAWLAGVLVVSVRMLLGWHFLCRLRATADEAAAAVLRPSLERLRQTMQLSTRVAVGISNRVRVPMVIGWLKPMILLPPSLITGLSIEHTEMILAHELAHIRRFDHWVNLFQIVVETLLFYHPVVAWVSRRIRTERENACDDLAVAATRNRIGYVEMLAALENERLPGPVFALGIHDGQILSRIRRLVQHTDPRRQRGTAIPMLIGVAAAFVLGMATVFDDLVDPAEEPATGSTESPAVANEALDMAETGAEPAQRDVTEPGETDSAPVEPVPTEPVGDDSASIAADAGTPTVSNRPDPVPVEEANDRPEASPEPSASSVTGPQSGASAAAESSASTTPATNNTEAETALVSAPDAERSSEVEAATDPEPLQIAKDRDRRMLLADAAQPALNALAAASLPEPPRKRESASPTLEGGALLHKVEPEYPDDALRRQVGGSVKLKLQINAGGRVERVDVLDESPRGSGFGSAAQEAVRQWRFEPFRRNGQPLAHDISIAFDFNPDTQDCGPQTGTRIPRC